MNIIFYIVYGIWFLSEILLNRLLRSKSSDRQNADRGTLSIIWITIIIFMSAAFIVRAYVYVPIFTNSSFVYIGIAVILAGIISA